MKFFVIILIALTVRAANPPIKNFLQIPYALESATDVSQNAPDIKVYYRNQKGNFPQKGELTEISVPGVLSQMSYGSYFCQKMIASDINLPPTLRWVHSQVDFTLKASEWSDAVYLSIFQDYGEIFWQRELETQELEVLKTEMPVLRATFANTLEANQQFLTSMCSAFAGSFEFLLLAPPVK